MDRAEEEGWGGGGEEEPEESMPQIGPPPVPGPKPL